MKHEPKDYQRLIAQCRGFLSETQLEAHFELDIDGALLAVGGRGKV